MMRTLSLLILVAVLGACSGEEPSDRPAPEVSIPFRNDGNLTFMQSGDGGVTINVEIAETDSARQRGLMQRTLLPEMSGMLFIFERNERQSFWMANTPLALDLIFVNSDSQIVDVAKYTRPFDSSSIVSDNPARYVIEVPAGFTDTHGIYEGQRVAWEREE